MAGLSQQRGEPEAATKGAKVAKEFWERKEYQHVYDAMKKSRVEIAESIRKRKLIFFETIPINFEEV